MSETTTPCARCGTFFPAARLNLDDVCSACVARELQAMPKLLGRALVAQLGLLGMSAAYLFVAALFLAAQPGTTSFQVGQALLGLLMLVSMPVAVVATLLWLHLAVRRAKAAGGFVSASPGWAVGSFFVPFAQMVVPFSVGRELLRHAGRSPAVATAWQVLWLGGGVVQVFVVLSPGNVVANVLANLAGCAATAMCVLMIAQVGRLDEAPSAESPQGALAAA